MAGDRRGRIEVWPIFPIAGWGVGVFFHAWDTFRRPPSRDAIRRELDRLAGTDDSRH